MTGFRRTIATPAKLTTQVQELRKFAREHPNEFANTQLMVSDKLSQLMPYRDNYTQRKIQRIIDEEEKARKPLRLYLLKSRRVGSSMKFVYRFFVKTWATDNLEAVVLAQQDERSEDLLERVKLAYAMLPKHLQLPLSKDSTSGLQYADTRGKITIASARNLAPARGGTKQLLLLSEFAIYKKALTVMREFLSPMAPEYGTEAIIETTGENYGSDAHDLWQRSRKGKTVFRAEFLDWRDDPECNFKFASDLDMRYKLGEAIEYEPRLLDRMKFYNLTPGQVYHSYRVLKSVCDGGGAGGWEFYLRDYPATEDEAWMSKTGSYFGTETVNKLQQKAAEFEYQIFGWWADQPLNKDIADLTDFSKLERLPNNTDENASRPFVKVWRMPRLNGRYIISGDSAEGLPDGNFSSSFVIDEQTFEMMAEFHGHCRPDQHAYAMAMLGNIYNGGICAPELNPPGNMTFMVLSEIYNNMYVWKHPLMDSVSGKNNSRKLGWVTQELSRSTMLNMGKRLAEDLSKERLRLYGILKSVQLLKEMGTFAPNEQTGKVEAIAGAQDDRVIAWCIAVIVAKQETHGTDALGELYDMEDEEPRAKVLDLTEMQLDPKDVIQNISEMFQRYDPVMFRQNYDKNNGRFTR